MLGTPVKQIMPISSVDHTVSPESNRGSGKCNSAHFSPRIIRLLCEVSESRLAVIQANIDSFHAYNRDFGNFARFDFFIRHEFSLKLLNRLRNVEQKLWQGTKLRKLS